MLPESIICSKDTDFFRSKNITEFCDSGEGKTSEHIRLLYTAVLVQAYRDLKMLAEGKVRKPRIIRDPGASIDPQEVVEFWRDGGWKEIIELAGLAIDVKRVEKIILKKYARILNGKSPCRRFSRKSPGRNRKR